MGEDCAAYCVRDYRADGGVRKLRSAAIATREEETRLPGLFIKRSRNWFLFIKKLFSLYSNIQGTPLAVLGCPFNAGGSAAGGSPPNGNGCANRQSVSHSSDDREQVQTARMDYNIDEQNITWFRFQADTGLQAAFTDPINRNLRRLFTAASVFIGFRLYACLFPEPGELFQSRIFVVFRVFLDPPISRLL